MPDSPHPYIPNSEIKTKKDMMREIGIKNIDELYADVPERYKLKSDLDIPKHGLSEFEIKRHVEELLSAGKACSAMPSFLGAGCWPHYVPALVKEIAQRSEFLTSYTPYQPEISQGMLQALFEYQSMICELTDMDVANCSMYDWATALGEAARMAARAKSRKEVLVPKLMHPERAQTLKVYVEPVGISIRQIAYDSETGLMDLNELEKNLSRQTAAVYVENPSYLGFVENHAKEIGQIAHNHGALFMVGVDPTSLGVLRSPGGYDADIVIGEAQPFGNAMNLGGPLLGIMACRDDITLVRQMPGRIVGMTTTLDGSKVGFCMALQTREQHIRRERATSNICSNEALCALSASVYMALLGPQGLRELGETITYKANYAIRLLSEITGVKAPVFRSSHFKEFTVNFDIARKTVKHVNSALLGCGIHGGKDISREFPELGETMLFCVTEIHSLSDIEGLVDIVEKTVSGK